MPTLSDPLSWLGLPSGATKRNFLDRASQLAIALLTNAYRLRNYSAWQTEEEDVKAWTESVNVFFVLSIGRSGTAFIAHLLNKSPRTYVVHEPVIADFPAYLEAFRDEHSAQRYVQDFRKWEIYARAGKPGITTYGEVNSILRRHHQALQRAFPNAAFIHLIRDGRDVVRSMMSRRIFTYKDPITSLLRPREGDPFNNRWSSMSRFEKVCWYWQTENKFLRNSIGNTVQLEKLVADYDYLHEKLLRPLNLDIPREAWERGIDKPKNATQHYQIPHWSAWDSETVATFEAICGHEMLKAGYDLVWSRDSES